MQNLVSEDLLMGSALGSELGSHNPALVELAALCLGARCQPLSGGGFKAVDVGF